MKKYDYVIVGAGLFGSTFAYEMTKRGKKCLVLDKRNHVGGNIYCEDVEGIHVHKYGAHIFHTSNKSTWEYVNQFATFEIDIPPQTEKGTQVVVHFELDENQILGVRTTVMTKPIIEKQVKIDRKSNLKLEELLIK